MSLLQYVKFQFLCEAVDFLLFFKSLQKDRNISHLLRPLLYNMSLQHLRYECGFKFEHMKQDQDLLTASFSLSPSSNVRQHGISIFMAFY